MKKLLFVISAFLLVQFSGFGQEPDANVAPDSEKMYLLGIGKVSLLDTYLSPEHYKGNDFRIYYESTKQHKDPEMSHSWMQHGEFSNTHPRSGNASELFGLYNIGYGLYKKLPYEIDLLPNLTLAAGAEAEAFIGGVYNTRNGNNPAQLHAGLDIAQAAKARYQFSLLKKKFTIDYKASLPILGVQFSPAYGQSYYEMFARGNYDHNIRLTTPFNALSFTQRLTISIPLKDFRLHFGYMGDYRQAKLNAISYHNFTHSFVIGYSL